SRDWSSDVCSSDLQKCRNAFRVSVHAGNWGGLQLAGRSEHHSTSAACQGSSAGQWYLQQRRRSRSDDRSLHRYLYRGLLRVEVGLYSDWFPWSPLGGRMADLQPPLSSSAGWNRSADKLFDRSGARHPFDAVFLDAFGLSHRGEWNLLFSRRLDTPLSSNSARV